MKKFLVLIIAITCGLFVFTSCGTSSSIKVGDEVLFGAYDRSTIDVDMALSTNGWITPIEWIVVAKDNGSYILLSKNLLYLDGSISSTSPFETSKIREDLNGEFYDTAFSDEEKGAIAKWTISNDNNSYECYLRLPSVDDITEWFPDAEDRIASTLFGKKWEYLVTPHSRVQKNGDIIDDGRDYGGIRPVIAVDQKYLDNRKEVPTAEGKDMYQNVEIGGLSFPLPKYYELSDNSTDTGKIYKVTTRDERFTGLLTFIEVEGKASDEEFDKSIDDVMKIAYTAGNGEIRIYNDPEKFENKAGLDGYRNTATVYIGGVECVTVLHLINNESEGKTVAVYLAQADHAGAHSSNKHMEKDLDKTVKNVKIITEGN